jgi:hypothetical protein
MFKKKLYIITTVGFDCTLLPKFLEYYEKFSPKKILIIVNSSRDSKIFKKVQSIIKYYGKLCLLKEWNNEFSEDDKIIQERSFLFDFVKEDNWVVYADLDEFQEYPLNIRTSIKNAERIGFDYLEGRMIDRINMNGNLTEYNDKLPLEIQYPIGGYITKELLKGWDKKIVCAKMKKIIGGGHHVFMNQENVIFNGHNTETYYEELSPHSFGIKIHHFKWNSHTIDKLKRELNYNHESLKAWREEHIRFLNYIKEKGKFDLSNANFKFQYYGNVLGI